MITRYYNSNMYDVFRPRGSSRNMAIVWTWQGTDSDTGFHRVAYRKARPVNPDLPISSWAMDYWARMAADGAPGPDPADHTDPGPLGP